MSNRFISKVIVTILFSAFFSNISAQKVLTKSEQEASNIIKYANLVIQMNNSCTESLSYYENTISTADQNAEKLKRNPNTQPFFVNCNVMSINKQEITKYESQMKAIQNFDEKDRISSLTKEAVNNTEKVGEWCSKISEYFSKGSYKTDDNMAQYPPMKDSLLYYVDLAYDNWHQASSLAAKAGDRAELILLKKSKIADFVIPMKTDLSSLKELLDLFKDKNVKTVVIKEKADLLSASINKNKDLTRKDLTKLGDIYYKEVYETFYRNCTNSLGNIISLCDKLDQQADGDQLNSLYSHASSSCGSAIEQYNTFINQ